MAPRTKTSLHQAGVLPEPGRDGHPALPVDLQLVGRRGPQSDQVAIAPPAVEPVPAWPPSAPRTGPASTATSTRPGTRSDSRRVRRVRGTSPAGSPFPCRRASARTCRRTVPLVIAPTMLPAVPGTRLFGFLPFTPLRATLRPTPPPVNHSDPKTPNSNRVGGGTPAVAGDRRCDWTGSAPAGLPSGGEPAAERGARRPGRGEARRECASGSTPVGRAADQRVDDRRIGRPGRRPAASSPAPPTDHGRSPGRRAAVPLGR